MNKKNIISMVSALMLVLAFINGVLFLLMSHFNGGMAFSGSVVEGVYYLGQGESLIEVSARVYYFNFWHGVSVLIMMALAFILHGFDGFISKNSPKNSRYDLLKNKRYRMFCLVICIFFVISIVLLPVLIDLVKII